MKNYGEPIIQKAIKAYRRQYLGNGYCMWYRPNKESYIRKDGTPHPHEQKSEHKPK